MMLEIDRFAYLVGDCTDEGLHWASGVTIQDILTPLMGTIFQSCSFARHSKMSSRSRLQQGLKNSFVTSKLPAKTRYFEYEGKFRARYNDTAVDLRIVWRVSVPR